MKIMGTGFVKKLIGCFSPDETQLDIKAINEIYANGYKLKKWTILSFRLPPLRLFKNSKLDVIFSDIFDKLPFFRSIGTTVFYEIRKAE